MMIHKPNSTQILTLLPGFILMILLTALPMTDLQAKDKGVKEIKIKTSAVCGMCKERIESGLAFEKGIRDVSLDIKSKIVTVTYKEKKTGPEKIRQSISQLGYDADEVAADPKAYNKLPACCKKDAPPHD